MTDFARGWLNKERICEFYNGKAYPALICFLVAFAGISGLEIYVGIIHSILVSVGLFISSSIKPALVSILTFVMQLSVKNSLFYPSYSDYLYTGWRIFALVGIFLLIFSALCAFIVKNRVYKSFFARSNPSLKWFLPLLVAFFG